MKLLVNRDDLHKAVQAVKPAATSKPLLPILSNVHIRAEGSTLELTATNLEIAVRSRLRLSNKVDAPGTITLSARQLFDIVAKLPKGGDVLLELEDQKITLRCARSRFVFPTLPAEEFPEFPKGKGEPMSLDAETLLTGIRHTGFAVAKDDKSTIGNVQMTLKGSTFRMVGTDGYRLAVWETEVDPGTNFEALIPGGAISDLARTLAEEEQALLTVGNGQLVASSGTVSFSSRIHDGAFPDVMRVIPTDLAHQVQLDRNALGAAVERMMTVAPHEAHVIELILQDGDLTLKADGQDRGNGDEVIPVDFTGQADIKFNGAYLLDALKSINAETVTLALNGPLAPALITIPDNPGYRYVLMPIRN